MSKILTSDELAMGLKKLTNWNYSNNKLTRSVEFKDYLSTLSFVNAVGFYSEKMNHHPEITFTYNKLEISYQTHDAQNQITQKDLIAAACVDKLI